jgi:ribosome-binding factor A
VSETIREELDELLAWEMADPRIQVSGVAEVLISPDARIAQVRVITEGGAAEQKQTLEALNHARAYIKRELANRVDLFRLPELRFEAAIGAELAPRVGRLLKRVRRGRPRPDTDPPATNKPSDQS